MNRRIVAVSIICVYLLIGVLFYYQDIQSQSTLRIIDNVELTNIENIPTEELMKRTRSAQEVIPLKDRVSTALAMITLWPILIFGKAILG